MDRAAFLRSLPFLRPLPPSTWAQIHAEPTSSCSTATPPTPGYDHDSVLLDDVVVSIEPVYRSENSKRVRDDDVERQPAFFACEQSTDEAIEVPPDIVDAEKDINRKKEEAGGAEKVDNDPALCSFQISIVKRKKMFSCFGYPKVTMTTPSKNDMDVDEDDVGESLNLESNVLLFRFGNYFVFEADPSAIDKVEHQPETDLECNGATNTSPEDIDVSHQSKRQRNDYGRTRTTKYDRQPSSLCIEYPSCTFRVFSMGPSTESNHISNMDTRLLDAKSKMMRHFHIGSSNSTWGIYSFDGEVIETENWSACLDQARVKEKVSPNKTDSSSHFENGQKTLPQIKPAVHNNDVGELNDSETQPIFGLTKSNDQLSSQKSCQRQEVLDSNSFVQSNKDETTSDETIMWNEISNKRRNFDNSWSAVHQSVSRNANASMLTSCAHALACSFYTVKQHARYNEQCDSQIECATGNIQELIEKIMPARERGDSRVSTHLFGSEADHEQSIDDLLQARKDAVAVKYALLLLPKK